MVIYARFVKLLVLTVFFATSLVAGELDRARELYFAGDVKGAIAVVRTFLRDHPRSATAHLDLGIYTRAEGVATQDAAVLRSAIAYFEKAGELTSDEEFKVVVLGNIATTHVELGDFAKALNRFNEAYKRSGRMFYKIRAAYCMARSGSVEEAIRLVESFGKTAVLTADGAGNEGLSSFNVGLIYALGNRASPAVAWLRRAHSSNPKRFGNAIRIDTDLNSIRKSTDFQILLKEVDAASR